MGCFRASGDSTQEYSLQSLRAMLATRQAPLSSPCTMLTRKLLERKLGFLTRKTLRARTKLLDAASVSLAKAKQRALISLPSPNNVNTETALFPLPLPPDHSSSTVNVDINPSSNNNIDPNSNNINPSSNNNIDPNSGSNSSTSPNASLHSDSITSCHSSSELTPSSSTSSPLFSTAPSSSSSNYSSLRCSSLSHIVDDHSFSTPLPLPSPNKESMAPFLREFSPHELAKACENFSVTHKLRNGAMGPVYRAILATNGEEEETSSVAIARMATSISRKKWKVQVQSLARLAHPNLCKIVGFSYERASYGEACKGGNTGFIVYAENPENGSLDEFLQDSERDQSYIDWATRLKIAIGAAEGLAFLLERMPKQILYGNFKMSNIQVDSLFNAKLSDFHFVLASEQQKDESAFDVRGFGLVLLQLFNFSSNGEPLDLAATPQIGGPFPPKDAKLVIDLAASCLLPEASLRPSMRHVARALRSIGPSWHVPKFALKPSRSFTWRRSFSCG